MRKVATCPYCGGDHFTNAVIRADKPDISADTENVEGTIAAMNKHSSVYGYWFNECVGCKGWSVYKHGKNLPLEAKGIRPKKHSLDKFKGI